MPNILQSHVTLSHITTQPLSNQAFLVNRKFKQCITSILPKLHEVLFLSHTHFLPSFLPYFLGSPRSLTHTRAHAHTHTDVQLDMHATRRATGSVSLSYMKHFKIRGATTRTCLALH
jgi:hypothetical protein